MGKLMKQAQMSNIEIVEKFIDAFNSDDMEAVYACLADDIFYHNIPLNPLCGIAAVRQFFEEAGPMTSNAWEILNIAENGPVVLTERVDRFRYNGKDVTIAVMGIFEIKDGKLKSWRDYFDLQTYLQQI
ncbi:MAG: limonene-1,2-epoxide hydrolase family protein [Sphingorhabdus sp.]